MELNINSEILRFQDHLDILDNERILFSGKFGSGKTTFLHKFFKDNKQYIPIFLYPTNYSIASNQDIMELVKYDILSELIKLIDVPNIQYETKELIFPFLARNLYPFLGNIIKNLPIIGKDIESLLSVFSELTENFKTYKQEQNKTEYADIIKFLESHFHIKGSIYENDNITISICNLITKLEETSGKKIVLIIDDLDRIDPEHIFRILNIFAAQADKLIYNQNRNKFNFNKVILVCDVLNIREIFCQRYGGNTDFNGYIDKFYTVEVFHFSIHKEVKLNFNKIIKNFCIDNPNRIYSFYQRDIIIKVLKDLFTMNKLSLRTLLSVNTIKLNYLEYYTKLGKFPPDDTVGVLYQYLKAIFHSEQKMMDAIYSLIDNIENFSLSNTRQSLISGYLCYFIEQKGLYWSELDDISISVNNKKYICKKINEPSELNVSYRLMSVVIGSNEIKHYSVYELIYKALEICSIIYKDGETRIS